MEKAYPFDPIDSAGEIRMLALNPAENGDPITCTLSHVSLDAEPEYEALSYTWDTDSNADTRQDTETISCSGHTMLVRENLFAALKRLRYPDRPRSLWVDAICINQADNEEKNHQVALMGSIYAIAKEVVIWLGEEEANDALAFDTIIRLERVFEKEPAQSDLVQQMWNSEGGPAEVPATCGNEWRALWGLLEKRWFKRAWVVQEVALARDATLVCGNFIMDFERFLAVIINTLSSGLGLGISVQGRSLRSGLPILSVVGLIEEMCDLQKSLRLFDLLVFAHGLQATDPRDKIFSLFSFLDFTGNDTEHVKAKKPWSVDYNVPTDELFRKTTAYCLFDEECLGILSLVNHGSRLDENGNTSWTLPQYITPGYPHVPLGFYLKATRKLAKPTGRYPCDHSHPSHISISGVLVDQIRAVSTVCESSDTSMPLNQKWMVDSCRMHGYINECEVMYSELTELSSSDAPCLHADAFWRTLICNNSDINLTPGLEYGNSFSIWREMIRRTDEDIRNGRIHWSEKDLENVVTEAMPFENSFNTW